ncbi:MAG TPA: DUF6265 family protein [Pseudobdellovibrionaceae bacterium]
MSVFNVKALILSAVLFSVMVTHAGPVAKVSDLDWLAGKWVGDFQGLPMEAYYTTASGGIILGQTKISNGNTAEFFEFEKIEQANDSLVLQPMPFGKPGVTFDLKEMGANRVVFENPQHDFPTRIIYELKSKGQLLGRIEGIQNGQSVVQDFLFSKAQ